MDPQSQPKLTKLNQELKYRLRHWLPGIFALAGILLSIIIWSFLIQNEYVHQRFVTSLKSALPWIVLVAGIAIALLGGIGIRLLQLMHERSATLARIDQNYKNEIVERMRAEDTKQKLEIALLQGQKLQAIGTLAGGIAHDFNNILYAIIGYVEMARDDVAEDSLIHKNLGKVLEASKRGQDLVSRILAFGRRHIHHEYQPLHLKTITESVFALLKPTIPASVSIDIIGMTDDYLIVGDQTQLHQVFVNIVNNAVDAMDGEGDIKIIVSRILANDPFLNQFPDIDNKNYYRIDIMDTGHGMDQHTMERIFEPFFTTKEVGKGTGLGLSTVHAIMQDHQGGITVTSQLGHGTTFTLLLPEYQSALNPEEKEHGYHTVSGR